MNEDFYIGYLPKMPPKLSRTIKVVVAILFFAAVSVPCVLWLAQNPFVKSVFEFGKVKEFAGTIQAQPIPFLLVETMPGENGLPRFERFPLVAEGKHGFAGEQFNDRRVRLNGTLIYRDDLKMIEVAGESVVTDSESALAETEKAESLGSFSLRGEIVDSKCYLGVMNPGSSKPHRDCAVACLRGGIPALFIVRDKAGNASELWLLSATGASVSQAILDYVAEPVEISGEVTRTGDQLFFKIDPTQITRLP